jgi:site-specific recombinase XerD
MNTSPTITIFVRHSEGCKYAPNEFSRKCNCRKFLRWFKDGKLWRKTTKTRSWTEAEKQKRELEDQFAGSVTPVSSNGKLLLEAIELFLTDKRNQGLSDDVVKKYMRLLGRLQTFCNDRAILNVQGITRDIITEFCSDWSVLYPSSLTRSKLRERLRSFLRYCYEAEWLGRIPPVSKFKIVEPETQPLTPEEYATLLDVVYVTVGNGDPRRQTTDDAGGRWQYKDAVRWQHAVYTFIQTMRWSGLAIRDTMTLRRDALKFDAEEGIYRLSTNRAKTGVPVCIPIPKEVGDDLLKVEVGGADYFFWSGVGKPQSATSNWGQRYLAPCFKAAGITSEGNMLSHRLRDTFAVYLLEHGASMEDVARLLGNSLRVCEKHYAKWSKGRQNRVDVIVSGTWATPPCKSKRPGRKPLGAKQVATRLELAKKSV